MSDIIEKKKSVNKEGRKRSSLNALCWLMGTVLESVDMKIENVVTVGWDKYVF